MEKVYYLCQMKKSNRNYEKYSELIEAQMVIHYRSLSELCKRHYAAVESLKLGYGGKSYICGLFKMGPNRLNRGLGEILSPSSSQTPVVGKIRCSGGGRKKFCKAS